MKCFSCGKDLTLLPDQKISRQEECPHCYQSLRCCKMCKHYDRSAYNECKEPTADRILEKDKANFCDHFVLSGGEDADADKQKAISAADALFKK